MKKNKVKITNILIIGVIIFSLILLIIYINLDHRDIRTLKSRTNDLESIEQIEVIYRPGHEWIGNSSIDSNLEEEVLLVTEEEEIRNIVSGFKETTNFVPYWTACGFYFKLNFYSEGKVIQSFIVGTDDCLSFTTEDVQAVGTMANSYFYDQYIVPAREQYNN